MKWSKRSGPQSCDCCHREYTPGKVTTVGCNARKIKHIDWICPRCGYDNKTMPPTGKNKGAIQSDSRLATPDHYGPKKSR